MSYKQLELDEANSHKLITESQVEYVCNFMTMPAKMWRDAGFESEVALEKMIFPNGLEFDIKARKFGTEQISPSSLLFHQKRALRAQIMTYGVPDTIRTYDLQFRKLTLYPAELQAHITTRIY